MTAPMNAANVWTLDEVKRATRNRPSDAQSFLEQEYKRAHGPRWTLVQWLKRHRPHNATTRVMKAKS